MKRQRIEKEEQLPPIRFINFKHLQKLSSFPRYPENADICVDEKDIDRSISLLIFTSHNWLRGWSGAEGYDGRPHPDNANNDKFKLLIDGINLLSKLASQMKNIYVWIDFGCINQNHNPAGELKQLDKIIQLSDLMLTIIVDNNWMDWTLPPVISDYYIEYQSQSWNDGDYAYINRAWCRVEMMYAANIPLCNDSKDRQIKLTAGLAEAIKSNRRPHYLYGTREKLVNCCNMICLPPLRNTFFEKYNPLNGSITKESDKIKIKQLIDDLQPYINANAAKEGYIGDRNTDGQMHDNGTFYYGNGDIYVGQFKNNLREGTGKFTYANGDVYEGDFKNDMFNGEATYTYGTGNLYIGTFKNDIGCGFGTFIYANGDKYVGLFKNGKMDGKGTFYHSTGAVYVGEYKKDCMEGKGSMAYDNGDKYIGQFKKDMMDGQGKYEYANGDVYVGRFKMDMMSGRGIYTYANGVVEDGNFENDNFTGKL